MSKPDLHVVSFSGGKDSTAMLLRMKELGMKIDVILYCDTTVEFPAMYEHVKKVEEYVGIPITVLRNDKDFEYYLLNYEPKKRNGTKQVGLSFPDHRVRWCTRYLKTDQINRYLKDLKKHYNVIEYVGLASDEEYRLERENNQRKDVRHPLVWWGWTEAYALQYCYNKGFDFGGLYELFNRVSCWCCPLQPLSELRVLRKEFPELWSKLLNWQSKTWRTFKPTYTVQELEIRFQFEEEKLARGESITNREFYRQLKERIKESEA